MKTALQGVSIILKMCPTSNPKLSLSWVRSFTLVHAPMMCQEVHGSGVLVPSTSTAANKKVLLVELDSFYKAPSTLPRVKLVASTLPGDDLVLKNRKPAYTVLVSLPSLDVRRSILVKKYGATTYRAKGNLEVLAVTFGSQDDADA